MSEKINSETKNDSLSMNNITHTKYVILLARNMISNNLAF